MGGRHILLTSCSRGLALRGNEKITKMSRLVLRRDSYENWCLGFRACSQSLFAFVQMQTDWLWLNFISELTPRWGYGYQSKVVKSNFVPHLGNANVLSLVKVVLPCEKKSKQFKNLETPAKRERQWIKKLNMYVFLFKNLGWSGDAEVKRHILLRWHFSFFPVLQCPLPLGKALCYCF